VRLFPSPFWPVKKGTSRRGIPAGWLQKDRGSYLTIGHTGNRTGRGGVNRGRLPDRFHRPERTIPNPTCHPELDSGSPRRGQCFMRGDPDGSEANARPESESGRTAEGVLRIGRMTSPAARGGTMRTTGDDLRPRVVRARVGNAGPWAERDGGQCDWPQHRQGGRCLRSWMGGRSGRTAGRCRVGPAPTEGATPRPGPFPPNREGLPWPVSPMLGDGLPLPESQIGHSPISSRRCPQIHRDRPVATCESGKRVLI
jgi:hypothetical protein